MYATHGRVGTARYARDATERMTVPEISSRRGSGRSEMADRAKNNFLEALWSIKKKEDASTEDAGQSRSFISSCRWRVGCVEGKMTVELYPSAYMEHVAQHAMGLQQRSVGNCIHGNDRKCGYSPAGKRACETESTSTRSLCALVTRGTALLVPFACVHRQQSCQPRETWQQCPQEI